MATGYKITDSLANSYLDLLSFIQAHGYNVTQVGGNVDIYLQRNVSLGHVHPAIFINDVPETNFSLLIGMPLSTIDEIYINKSGYGGGLNAAGGIIRIYTKKGVSGNKEFKIKSKSLVAANVFQKFKKYENPKYINTFDKGFVDYGIIDWKPTIKTNQYGNFRFAIPHIYIEKVHFYVEGITSTGNLISEIVEVEINNLKN